MAEPETCLGPNMDCGRPLPCPDHPAYQPTIANPDSNTSDWGPMCGCGHVESAHVVAGCAARGWEDPCPCRKWRPTNLAGDA